MDDTGTSRRKVLAGAGATAAVSTAGCLSELRSRLTYSPASQLSLTIKAVPADREPTALLIAQQLRDHLEAVGVDVAVDLLSEEQLFRDVLLNHDFDVVVSAVRGLGDPDELRTMLHSRFGEEEGWQNPFGYSTRHVDELLEKQAAPSIASRRNALADIQYELVGEPPFVTVASPNYVTAAWTGLSLEGPERLPSPLAYLTMTAEAETLEQLNVSLRFAEVTENRNVLSAEYRTRDRLLDLLYDPLVQRIDGETVPWLATEISGSFEDGAVYVELRENVEWHDGTPLTADDVAFTYRFLSDTALGETDSPVPAPRYRTQSSLVTGQDVIDDHTVVLRFDGVREDAGRHALTAPILPEHTWSERTGREHQHLTQAIVDNVAEPVGSGPLAFDSATEGQSITLRRNDDHFLRTDGELDPALEPFEGGPVYEQLHASVPANIGSAFNDLESGAVDLIDGRLAPEDAQTVADREGLTLIEEPTTDYYMIGFNTRRAPLSNYRFRGAIARLVDRDYVVDEILEEWGRAIETPLHDTEFIPDDLEWDGTSWLGGFPGEYGTLDEDAAQDLFRDAGFRYHDGELRGRQ